MFLNINIVSAYDLMVVFKKMKSVSFADCFENKNKKKERIGMISMKYRPTITCNSGCFPILTLIKR
jgi:hypothetical protein